MTHPEPLTLDVRPLLARGEEPFAAIMAAADSLRSGQVLRLLAPFRPVPLFSVMTNRGFTAEEHALPGGLCCLPDGGGGLVPFCGARAALPAAQVAQGRRSAV